jgi:transcriptional/translational regulatory protein YebC/TACO1
MAAVAEALEGALGAAKSTQIIWRPKTETPVSGSDAATLMKLFDALDDDDDVQNVFSNEDIPEDELAQLTA